MFPCRRYTFSARNANLYNFLTGLGYVAHKVHDITSTEASWHGRKLKPDTRHVASVVTAAEIAFVLPQ